MPNGSAFADAVRIAKGTPDLGVGIHISLVGERCVAPLERVPRLAGDQGLLPASYLQFAKRFALRSFGLDEVRTEIEAQVQRVLDAGISPTHLDSHQHLHVFPGISAIVADIAVRHGIRVVRAPRESRGVDMRPFSSRAAQLAVLIYLSRRCAPRFRRSGLQCVDHFWGLGTSGRLDESRLLETISRLRPGVNEIMCHPGFSDPETSARYPWRYRWDDEASALTSPRVRTELESRNIRPMSFADAWSVG